MKTRLIPLASLLLLANLLGAEKRHTPVCKTPAIASSCYQTHGRLAVYNGGAPNFRLWEVGTTHLLGIFTDEADKECTRGTIRCGRQDEENPELPTNLTRAFGVTNTFDVRVFADFEVCPLETHIPGHMQAACVESATHLFVQKN